MVEVELLVCDCDGWPSGKCRRLQNGDAPHSRIHADHQPTKKAAANPPTPPTSDNSFVIAPIDRSSPTRLNHGLCRKCILFSQPHLPVS